MNPHTSYFRPAALLLAIVVLALTPASKGAGVTEAWVQRSNIVVSNSQDQAYKVVRDAAGDFIVTGSSSVGTSGLDMLTLKYSGASGALLWQKRYNGPANKDDSPTALDVDSSGNVVVTGSSDNGTNTDFYTAKYAAANGALLWEQRYNGPANTNDSASAVAVDGNGNVIVTGSSDDGTNTDFYTAKYAAANGALLWEKRYNGPANGNDHATAVAVDGDGNVIVTGSSDNGTNSDFYTAKYAAANGALLWEKRYNGPANYYDSATAVAVDGNGNVIVTGDDNGTAYTAKYATADGALLWEQRYDGPLTDDDDPTAVVLDTSGNVVVTGGSFNASHNSDFYTVKYAAADGALLWEKRSSAGNGIATAEALDPSGNVVVTGFLNNNYYTAKYVAATGALLWQRSYNGPANNLDQAHAVAVDGSGNVVVTGYSVGSVDPATGSQNYDYYTAKYAAANGALLWAKRYNGPGNGYDYAFAVAVDGSGNVVVTGTSFNGTNNNSYGVANYDYYTAKYAAADGALLWEKRYNGPANGEDSVALGGSGSLLALGPNGRVVVAGSSAAYVGSGAIHNITTVVYREPLPPVSITLVPTGVHLQFTGVAGHSYNIERAPAVTGPWSTLATPTAPLDGLIDYTDTNPPAGAAYYRTSTP